jgi:hypothetical protein
MKIPTRGVLALTLLVFVSGCSLSFIKKRLPPPYRVENGYLFQFYSPSAHVVQLCGNWETNNW